MNENNNDNIIIKNYIESCKKEIKQYIKKSNKSYADIASELPKYNINISENALRLRIDRNPDYYLVKAIMEIIGYKLVWQPFDIQITDMVAKEIVNGNMNAESLAKLKITISQLNEILTKMNGLFNNIDIATKKSK